MMMTKMDDMYPLFDIDDWYNDDHQIYILDHDLYGYQLTILMT